MLLALYSEALKLYGYQQPIKVVESWLHAFNGQDGHHVEHKELRKIGHEILEKWRQGHAVDIDQRVRD